MPIGRPNSTQSNMVEAVTMPAPPKMQELPKLAKSAHSTQTSDDMDSLQPAVTNWDRAYNYIKNMTGRQVYELGMELFQDNRLQRGIFYTWVRRVQLAEDRYANPKSFPYNLVGEPGVAKSGMIYSMTTTVEDWLHDKFGKDVEFRVITKTLGGKNDLAELLGIVQTKMINGVERTVIAPFEDIPVKGDKVFAIMFVDDFNRGFDHVQAGTMEWINTGNYNGLRVGNGVAFALASNPHGQGHKTKGNDKAQRTRFFSIPVIGDLKGWFNNMAKQGVAAKMIAYAMKYKPVQLGVLANLVNAEPEVNMRNFTMLAHMYDIIRYDDHVLNDLASAVLGPNAIRNLHALLQGELPLDPEEIIGVNHETRKGNPDGESPTAAWKKAQAKFQTFAKENRTDLIAVSMHSLVTYLNKPEFNLSDDQLDVLGELFTLMPSLQAKESATDALRRLILKGCPRADYFNGKFTMWKSTNNIEPGPLAVLFFDLMGDMKRRLQKEAANMSKAA